MTTLVALSVTTTERGPFLDPNGILYLEPVSAHAFEAMNAAALRELGIPIDVTEAGRTWARQNYLYQGWLKHLPGFNLALPPGMSIHEKYRAADFGGPFAVIGTREHDWLVKRGPAFGWIWTGAHFTHVEGWHFEQNGLVVAATASNTSTPLTPDPPRKKKKMPNAVVDQEQGSATFNWIAVVTDNGELHEVSPGNRGWWDALAGLYSPALTAVPTNHAGYGQFVAANQTMIGGAFPTAQALAAQIVAALPTNGTAPTVAAIVAALTPIIPTAVQNGLAARNAIIK